MRLTSCSRTWSTSKVPNSRSASSLPAIPRLLCISCPILRCCARTFSSRSRKLASARSFFSLALRAAGSSPGIASDGPAEVELWPLMNLLKISSLTDEEPTASYRGSFSNVTLTWFTKVR